MTLTQVQLTGNGDGTYEITWLAKINDEWIPHKAALTREQMMSIWTWPIPYDKACEFIMQWMEDNSEAK